MRKGTCLDNNSSLYERSAGTASFRHIEEDVQIVALPLTDSEIMIVTLSLREHVPICWHLEFCSLHNLTSNSDHNFDNHNLTSSSPLISAYCDLLSISTEGSHRFKALGIGRRLITVKFINTTSLSSIACHSRGRHRKLSANYCIQRRRIRCHLLVVFHQPTYILHAAQGLLLDAELSRKL